jgi:O-antigen/teichoic acid export membrane protein
VTGVGIGLALKTSWDGVCAGAAAAIAVGSQLVLTPRFGPAGAAAGTWLGYGTAAVLHYWVAQRFYPLPYQGARWLTIFLVANALALAVQRLSPAGPVGFTIKLVVAVAFASMAMTLAMGRIDVWRAPRGAA